MTLNYKKLIGIVLVFAVALLTGFTVGRIYLDHLPKTFTTNLTYEDIKQDEKYINNLISQVKSGKSVASFSAFDLYLIAEQNLYSSENYLKTVTGSVDVVAMGVPVSQPMLGQRLKYGDTYVVNKMSKGLANICSQTIYNAKTDQFKINSTGNLTVNGNSLSATFDTNNFVNYSKEDYLDIFKVTPNLTLPYIISDYTCKLENFSAVEKKDGYYTFTIKPDKDKIPYAALYYSYEIKFSSGLSDIPSWNDLSLTVTIDDNFNFVQIEYKEVYSMDYKGFPATVTDSFVDSFVFGDDVPTPQELTGREVL